MSHITRIKTNVNFKDKNVLEAALKELETQFSDLTYSYDHAKDQYLVRYPPIEGYQKNGNLRFVYSGGNYQMQGDSWMCEKSFEKVTGQVIVNYQKFAVQRYLMTKRYSNTVSTSDNGVIVTARRY
jgi:hypothetical protein